MSWRLGFSPVVLGVGVEILGVEQGQWKRQQGYGYERDTGALRPSFSLSLLPSCHEVSSSSIMSTHHHVLCCFRLKGNETKKSWAEMLQPVSPSNPILLRSWFSQVCNGNWQHNTLFLLILWEIITSYLQTPQVLGVPVNIVPVNAVFSFHIAVCQHLKISSMFIATLKWCKL